MNKLLLTAIFLCFVVFGNAQQLHFTSQFIKNNPMYNPAAAGLSNESVVGLSYRNQWSSFSGNPKTYMVYGDFELNKLNAGLGAYLYRDETGPTSRNGVQLAYSYHINAKNGKDHFAIGLEARGLNYAIDKNKLSAGLANDPAIAGSDNKTVFDAGAGLYYTNDKLSVGAAVSQLVASKLQLNDVPSASLGGRLYRHYNFTANYTIDAGDNVSVTPNAMVRVIEHSPTEFEAGALANYKDKIWWGVGFRYRQSIMFQAGLKLADKVSFGYAYDFYTTPIDVFSDGSGAHELSLRFHFK